MSTARILIKQSDRVFRLLRLETTADGSVAIIVDRDPDIKRGGLRLGENGVEVDDFKEGEIAPHGKFTCHVTGQVNRWASGVRKQSHFVEPLTRLSNVHLVGIYSIPTIARLDSYNSAHHPSDVVAELEIPLDVEGRITVAIEVAPRSVTAPPTYGVSLGYETYAAIVRFIEFSAPEEMKDRFIEGSPRKGAFLEKQVDIPEAEIEFYRAAHPGQLPILREDGGAYVVIAAVPMRIPPKLVVEFARPDLSAEQAPFAGSLPTHKVRFWIRDKGGRNKKDDLRAAIASIALDARFEA